MGGSSTRDIGSTHDDVARFHSFPINISVYIRIQLSNSTIYCLEILRRDSTLLCPPLSLLRTWVHTASQGEFISISSELRVEDCDGKMLESDTSIVSWERDIGVDLLVERRGWESEWYAILTIDDKIMTERTKMSFRGR